MVLLPISLLITALFILCLLKILRTLQSSSLLVTNYRRQRDPRNTGTNTDLIEQKSGKSTETPSQESIETTPQPSPTDPKKKFGRQDTYFGTFFPDKV